MITRIGLGNVPLQRARLILQPAKTKTTDFGETLLCLVPNGREEEYRFIIADVDGILSSRIEKWVGPTKTSLGTMLAFTNVSPRPTGLQAIAELEPGGLTKLHFLVTSSEDNLSVYVDRTLFDTTS